MTRKRHGRFIGDANSTARPGISDPPTDSDSRRIRKARRQAGTRYAAIEAVRDAEEAVVFRAELGAIVRSASPLLISLLAIDGLILDDAIALVKPRPSWRRQTRFSGRSFGYPLPNHLLRYYVKGMPPGRLPEPSSYEHTFHRADGDYLKMKVVTHSVELEARIAPVWIETRFGELRVQLDETLPETVAGACVGRPIEEIVDHQAWRGRGWQIVDVEEPVTSYFGQTLIVAMGSVPYRVTWPEPEHPTVTE